MRKSVAILLPGRMWTGGILPMSLYADADPEKAKSFVIGWMATKVASDNIQPRQPQCQT